MLTVTIYPDAKSISDESVEGAEFSVEYVSLVNKETYGAPALVAPTSGPNAKRAEPGEAVLYINTNLVAAFVISEDID